MKTSSYLLSALLILALSITAQSQGWERTYPHSTGRTAAFDVLNTADGGFLLGGEADLPTGASRHYIRLIKTDANGLSQWEQVYYEGAIRNDRLLGMAATPDGGYMLGVSANANNSPGSNGDMGLIRVDAQGDTLWTRYFNVPSLTATPNMYISSGAFTATADGGFLLATAGFVQQTNAGPVFIKTDADGNLEWVQHYLTGGSPNLYQQIHGLVALPDGYAATGNKGANLLLIRTDLDGSILWQQEYTLTTSAVGYDLCATTDGGLLIGGGASGVAGYGAIVLKTDSDGNQLWWQGVGSGVGNVVSVEPVPGQGYILAGSLTNFWQSAGGAFLTLVDENGDAVWERLYPNTGTPGTTVQGFQLGRAIPRGNSGYVVAGLEQNDMYMGLTDNQGYSISHWIMGNVYQSSTCLTDDIIRHMPGWTVRLTSATGQTHYTTTDDDGNYRILVDTGFYTVVTIPPSLLWQQCGVYTIHAENFYDTSYQNIQVIALANCPSLSVDVASSILRRCVNNTYHIRYCNNGSEPAQDASVVVTLDPHFTITNSSLPYLQLGNNQYSFAVGDLDVFECGNIQLSLYLECSDATVVGQSHCVTAHIYPDTICLPAPNAPFIDVNGFCNGDQVRFTLQNIGNTDMGQTQGYYVVIEDDVMYMQQTPYNLDSGESINVDLPANGATYRLETQLSPGNTSFTGQEVSATVEGCGFNATNVFSTGFVNLFPLNDNTPFEDIDCRVSVGSYDPNDKQAVPIGYGEPHYIKANVPIEYMIRFQNTGTDTAFQVIVRDTLSPWLDPTTVQPGASSHNYRFELNGDGILNFHFDNIMLPDSNVNLEASQGFVKFTVSQLRDNPIGTFIENNAAIYFDFNAPIITNTTYHTIGDNFVVVSYEPGPAMASYQLSVFPNPASRQVELRFDQPVATQDGRWLLHDARGQLIRQGTAPASGTTLEISDLPRGVYFLQWRVEGQMVAQGKLIVQ